MLLFVTTKDYETFQCRVSGSNKVWYSARKGHYGRTVLQWCLDRVNAVADRINEESSLSYRSIILMVANEAPLKRLDHEVIYKREVSINGY